MSLVFLWINDGIITYGVSDEFHGDPDLVNNIDKLLEKHLKPFLKNDVSDVKDSPVKRIIRHLP